MSRYAKFATVLAILVVIGFVALPALARGKQGQAGKSNISHRDLDPQDGSEAWGKIKFNLSGATLKFVFNGHGLVPGENYVLKSAGIDLGFGTANEDGDVHIAAAIASGTDLQTIEDNAGRMFNLRTAGALASILQSAVYEFDYIAP